MAFRAFPSSSLVLCALLLGGCAQMPAEPSPGIAQEQQLYELREVQRRFGAETLLPQTFDFPGNGRVTVRELTLDGYPGNTYLRCRFHYQNTTGRPVVQSWVALEVLDGEGRIVASQASCCIVPVPIPIAEKAFFADELRTKTFGVHDQKGWSWRITCKSQLEMPETDSETEVRPAK